MKKTVFYSVLLMLLASCTSDMPEPDSMSIDAQQSSRTTYSKAEVLRMANEAINGNTRAMPADAQIIPILSSQARTRSGESDTVAFVVNYPKEGGFAIISHDKRMIPILAFSETSNLDCNDSFTKNGILENIASLRIEDPNTIYKIPGKGDGPLPGTFEPRTYGPYLQFAMHQGAPYNNYMDTIFQPSNSPWPAGCVPVAAVYAMTHAKDELDYKEKKFNFKAIRNAMSKGESHSSSTPEIPITYTEAQDQLAWLLYHVGKDLKVWPSTYTSGGSVNPVTLGFLSSCCNFFEKYHYEVSPYMTYSKDKAIEYLKDNHILGISSTIVGTPGSGHSWIMDGYKVDYLLSITKDEDGNDVITDTKVEYLHCDFGHSDSEYVGYFLYDVLNSNHLIQTVKNTTAVLEMNSFWAVKI